ncbi:hypothetical protein ACVIQY_004238 [Bradyrhizobium sp. USDA 3051]
MSTMGEGLIIASLEAAVFLLLYRAAFSRTI